MEKRDGTVVCGRGMVSTFVKRIDNGTLPRGRKKRTSNGGVDNGTRLIGDDYMVSNKGSRK